MGWHACVGASNQWYVHIGKTTEKINLFQRKAVLRPVPEAWAWVHNGRSYTSWLACDLIELIINCYHYFIRTWAARHTEHWLFWCQPKHWHSWLVMLHIRHLGRKPHTVVSFSWWWLQPKSHNHQYSIGKATHTVTHTQSDCVWFQNSWLRICIYSSAHPPRAQFRCLRSVTIPGNDGCLQGSCVERDRLYRASWMDATHCGALLHNNGVC